MAGGGSRRISFGGAMFERSVSLDETKFHEIYPKQQHQQQKKQQHEEIVTLTPFSSSSFSSSSSSSSSFSAAGSSSFPLIPASQPVSFKDFHRDILLFTEELPNSDRNSRKLFQINSGKFSQELSLKNQQQEEQERKQEMLQTVSS